MSHLASDDSEYCSDFSCDSLNLSTAGRGEDCEIVPSAETSVSVNGANDSFETEVMGTDPQLPWYDATETFLMTAGDNNIEPDDSPEPSPNASSDEAWTAGYVQALTQPPNGMDDMPQLFDRLTLASGGITKTARSDDGYCRRKSSNIRVARSWSCLRNLSPRRTKTTPPYFTSKQISYLELYRRKTCGIGAATKRPVNTEKQEDKQHLLVASKKSTEKEMQQSGPECPSDTLDTNASDVEKGNEKSEEFCDVMAKEVIEQPCSTCPSEKQFIQAACKFTKSLGEHVTQNKKPYTKRPVNNLKNLRQAPLKLGSLGFDKEAVKEKYDRFKKQQCYGDQVSIRNRMKMSQIQKASDKFVEDKKDVNVGKTHVPESDVIPKKSGHFRFELKSDTRQKNETSKAARAKSYSQTIRASALASRRAGLKSMSVPSTAIPVSSHDSMDTIKPLVERHMKENEIVDTIRRSFGRTKLNLKP